MITLILKSVIPEISDDSIDVKATDIGARRAFGQNKRHSISVS